MEIDQTMEPSRAMWRAVPLFWPHVPEASIQAVQEVLRTRWIGQGPKVDELEDVFRKFSDAPAAVSVNSCTSALHLALILAGVGPGDEVITTPLTCSATVFPILYCGAKPVFADICPETLNIDPNSIESHITERTKALLIVDWGGYPCDLDEMIALARIHGLAVVEDAAHALGAFYRARPIGSVSDFTCFSFQAIKQITSGDGGMLTFRNTQLLDRARRLRWFDIDRTCKGDPYEKFYMREVGYKYHMNDIAAALLLGQMATLGENLDRRRAIAKRYREDLVDVDGLVLPAASPDRTSGHWLFTVRVKRRDDFRSKLLAAGIESELVHIRCDVIPVFGGKRLSRPGMNAAESEYICIPLNNHLSDEDVEHVIRVIQSGW